MSGANSPRSDVSDPPSPPKGSLSNEPEEDEVSSYLRNWTSPEVEEFKKELKRRLAANRLDIAGRAAREERQRELDRHIEEFGEVERPPDWELQFWRGHKAKLGKYWRPPPSPERPQADDK